MRSRQIQVSQNLRKTKNLLKFLMATPFHPQWLSRQSGALKSTLENISAGSNVLDVGCNDRWVRDFLPDSSKYMGLDYWDTARDWYGATPDVYGDAHSLPIENDCMDIVLMLDVLEHLEAPETAIAEAARVLAPNGAVIIQIPFLYPIHDAPRDFQRLTEHGLKKMLHDKGLRTSRCLAQGHPMETAALLANIALAKTVINWGQNLNPLTLLGLLMPAFWITSNLLSKLIASLSCREAFMPISYLVIAKKVSDET